MGKPSAVYEIIYSIVSAEDNVQSVKELCQIAGVSRSGYYNWVNSANKRAEREARDRADFELILEAYNFRGYAKGIDPGYETVLCYGISFYRKTALVKQGD